MILNAKHYRAIELILEGKENKFIANDIGISIRTLILWKNNPEFRAEFEKLQDEMFHRIYRRIISTESKLYEESMKILEGNNDNLKVKIINIMYRNLFDTIVLETDYRCKYKIDEEFPMDIENRNNF